MASFGKTIHQAIVLRHRTVRGPQKGVATKNCPRTHAPFVLVCESYSQEGADPWQNFSIFIVIPNALRRAWRPNSGLPAAVRGVDRLAGRAQTTKYDELCSIGAYRQDFDWSKGSGDRGSIRRSERSCRRLLGHNCAGYGCRNRAGW